MTVFPVGQILRFGFAYAQDDKQTERRILRAKALGMTEKA